MSRATIFLAALFVVTNASAQDTPLRLSEPQTATISAGDTLSYKLSADADQYVSISVEQTSVNTIVRILNPDDQMIRRMDAFDRGTERLQFETESAGDYSVEIIADPEETGEFTVTVVKLEPVETDPERLVDQLMFPYSGEDSPGAAVAVFRNGQTVFAKSYGMANLTYGLPFEIDTRTNIGSTSKQFTAFAVMLLVERGELSLEDDIRQHIPELPDFGETITVRNIITHTSGLREFLNLLIMTGRRLDHGDHIDRSELIDIVKRQPELQNSPGAEWNYNNTAYGFAALIVERVSGQPFHEFMRDNVFLPLGMTRTMVRPNPKYIVPERSEGYTPRRDGSWAEIGDLGGAVGAGGIYTTLEDLGRWVRNFSTHQVGTAETFEQMMTPFVLTDGDTTNYGFGLMIDEQGGLRRIHHGGADVAHRSMLAYYPEIDAAITAQSNHAGFNSGVAFRLAEAFFGHEMEADEDEEAASSEDSTFDPEAYDPEDFDEFVGRYSLDVAPDFILSFFREEDKFYTQATGQPRVEILPTSDSTFALTIVDASIAFHKNDEGEVDGLTLFQGGERHATRLPDEEEEEWKPTAEDLAQFVGRYFSEEIETFYDISLEDDTLVVRQRRMDDIKLTPGKRDEFSGGIFSFEFERGSDGGVAGFALSNGRTRGVKFEKTDGR